jgi:hypothetical protein
MQNRKPLHINVEKIEAAILDNSGSDATFEQLVRTLELQPESDFRHVDLAKVDFGVSNLTGFDFSFSDLRGSNFSNAILKETKFIKAKTHGAKWPEGYAPQLDPRPEEEFISKLHNFTSFLASNDRAELSENYLAALASESVFYVIGLPSWVKLCGLEFPNEDQLLEGIELILSGHNILSSKIILKYDDLISGRDYMVFKPEDLKLLRRPQTFLELSPFRIIKRSFERTLNRVYGSMGQRIAKGRLPQPLKITYLYILAVINYVMLNSDQNLHFDAIWTKLFGVVRILPAIYQPTAETIEQFADALDVLKKSGGAEDINAFVLKMLIDGGCITSRGIEMLTGGLRSGKFAGVHRSSMTKGFSFTRISQAGNPLVVADIPLFNPKFVTSTDVPRSSGADLK